MSSKLELYKCEICRNIVEVVNQGAGILSCCETPMKLQLENSVDGAVEKHAPKIVKLSDGYEVTVGELPHPSTELHYIQWVELIKDGVISIKFLKPGEEAKIIFKTSCGNKVTARAYCNIHGLWKS